MSKSLCDDAEKTLVWFENNHMKANPSKFQGFAIMNQEDNENICLSLSGVDLPISETVKLLGLYIDHKLNFNEHVSKLCKKAGFHVSAMSRVAKYLDTKSLLNVFHAFIRSNFQYSNIVWHFTSKPSILKMEKIQRRALRIVFNDYTSSYADLLLKANVSSLYVSRLKNILIETFKTINKINPQFLHDLFEINDTEYALRDPLPLLPPKFHTTTYGRNSFTFEASKLWNNLPNDLKHIRDLDEFSSEIHEWSGPECTCYNCILCHINLL